MTSSRTQREFQCPGEPAGINRAVHLARLADGYPACRECGHRDDVEGLTERSRKRIPGPRVKKRPADFLADEGVWGELHNGFDSILAGRFAAGFGMLLREEVGSGEAHPCVAAATDGRAVTQRHFARIVEQLRWAGCDVVELGSVPCPALPWAMGETGADGGIYLGNPQGDPHRAGMRLYGRGGRLITGLASLQAVSDRVEEEPARPVRTSGKAEQADVLDSYTSRFSEYFHGLRPLRFGLHVSCRPAGGCVERLLSATACRMVLHESETAVPAGPLPEAAGHFAAAMEDDGQRLRLWDERGRPVAFETLFLLIAGRVYGGELSGRTVVLGEGTGQVLAAALEQRGPVVERCGPLPSEMHGAMAAHRAALGADKSGRIWYGEAGGSVIADALATLALVLSRLSEGDRPLSAVLDAEAARH